MPKRKRNADGSYSAGARSGRRSYPYAVATKYRKRAVGRAGVRGSAGSRAYWGSTWDDADEAQRERRALMHYRGDGDYRSALKWGSRGLGAAAGALLAGYGSKSATGALKGGQTGYDLGAGFSKYMGWGDYAGAQAAQFGNQIMGGGAAGQRNIAVNRSDMTGDVTYEHTEFVQNIVVQPDASLRSPFTVQSFGLNAGLEATFPFLAQLAANFTMYELEGLIFHYKPTTGEGGTNALGKVIMATDYDPSARAFTNSQAMENYDYSSSGKPSVEQYHGVETARGQRLTNQLYIRTEHSEPGPSPLGQKDKVLTDIGLFQVATEGIVVPAAGVTIVGELWVTYKVRLSRASLQVNQRMELANFDRYMWKGGVGTFIGATDMVGLNGNSLGGAVSKDDVQKHIIYTWPESVVAGTYRVIYTIDENMAATIDRLQTAHCKIMHLQYGPYSSGLNNTVPSATDVVINSADATGVARDFSHWGVEIAANPGAKQMISVIVEVLAPDNAQAEFKVRFTATPGGAWVQSYSVEQISTAQADNALDWYVV